MFVDLRDTPLSLDEALDHVRHPGAGGIDVFLGVVRDVNDGEAVVRLEYSAYASMARAELTRIARGIEDEIPGVRVAALHRIGSLAVGDLAVVCAASAPHRGEAFRACRLLIDRIKATVPIWKREHGPDGARWVGWVDARCAADDHGHAGHAPAGYDHAAHADGGHGDHGADLPPHDHGHARRAPGDATR